MLSPSLITFEGSNYPTLPRAAGRRCCIRGPTVGDAALNPPLTGSCFSRQMLKFLVWLGFSFFSGIRVSPMNSLWRNLSSSQTEILQEARGERVRWGEGRQWYEGRGCPVALQVPSARGRLRGHCSPGQ